MADPNTRQGKRTPVTLKIKFKSETLEQFIERYAVDVSQGGIFIRTKDPLAVGTQMKFEFQLRDASPLIAGEGTVVWTRENDPSRPAIAPGMGVRFDRLAEGSQNVLEKILAEKAKQAPQRSNVETTKPPLFTDTPTRVAPAPVQDALMGGRGDPGRSRSDSEQTPLPKPMPFHSDADEFGAEAFEEATKVRALDELVAATAGDEQAQRDTPPADELALRRPTPLAEERDSAPALPSAPEASGATGRTGKLLDTSPSPRSQSPSSPPLRPSQPLTPISPSARASGGRGDEPARTKLGVEPARLPGRSSVPPLTVPADELPTERPSVAPVVIGILVVVAAAVAAVWYFVLRTPVAEEVASERGGSVPGSATPQVGSALPELGNTVPDVGSAAQLGSAVTPGPTLETEIAANAPKATVTIVDTGDSGVAPFKAKLIKDKVYKVRVEAAGFVTQELTVRGGQDKATAKLIAMPHMLTVKSDPPGAQIYIDSSGLGHVTPYEVELTAPQAAKPRVRVTLRKVGYRTADQIVDGSAFHEEDQQLVAAVEVRLAPAPVPTVSTTHTSSTNAGSASTPSGTPITSPDGGGSAAATPSGTGSATTPGTTSPGAGSAAAPTPTPLPSPSAGSAEPEPVPDFVKKPTP